jgi:hypothetical protein
MANGGERKERLLHDLLVGALALYLVVVAAAACLVLIQVFPTPVPRNAESAVPVSAAYAKRDQAEASKQDEAKGDAANEPQTIPPGPAIAAPSNYPALVFGSIAVGGWRHPVKSTDQGLVILALVAGLLGSFMHAGQSLSAYVGNQQLRASWGLWYILRPPIGAVLGLLFYFILRAGLVPAATSTHSDAISPYGVVAFGALAGWFSKRATDKLAEVFETLFRTAKDGDYRNPLASDGKPRITGPIPAKLSLSALMSGDVVLTFTCERLAPGAWARLAGQKLATQVIDTTRLSCTVPQSLAATLAVGQKLELTITNPPPLSAPTGTKEETSDPIEVVLEV